MDKRNKPTPEQRIAEYVDSPLMKQRIRFGKLLLARVLGNYGVYRTQAKQGKKVVGDCSCPSEWLPCKHVHALRETWQANPQSFFDLDQFLAELFERPKAELIEAIGQMVVQSPQSLSAFGVPGFDKAEDGELTEEELED